MSAAIDTGKVTGRRPLHFDSIADIAADIDKLAGSKELRTLGNWSPGQICKHLATTMNGSVDGITFRAAWYIRLVVQLFFKRRFLTHPMPAGFQLPRGRAMELIPPPTSTEEGFHSIRAAIERVRTEPGRGCHPVLGQLTREEWDQMHCRHAELHLSFIVSES